ncbi:AvrE-family type 3 secretion system effector [Spartinivicinus ruber]|uniref:AvrE-family type 3 secretion system effector n=1 Tax=Spartinivicinus ruber TaxID=2683272 RepID=UPI0013D718FA|nr:AvrE-family type 3 secretion system effector [Spartinivicinus ruber]
MNVQLPKNINVSQVKVSGNGEQLWVLSNKGQIYQFTRQSEVVNQYQYNESVSALLNQGNNHYVAIETAQNGTLFSVDNLGFLYQVRQDKGLTRVSRSSDASFSQQILQNKVSAKGIAYQQVKSKISLALAQGQLKILSNGIEQGRQPVKVLTSRLIEQAAGIYTAPDGQRWLLENNQLFNWNDSQQQWKLAHDKSVSQLRVGKDGQLYALSEGHEIFRLNNNTTTSIYRLAATDKRIQDFTVQQNQQIAFIDTAQNYSVTSTNGRITTTPVVLPDGVKATALVNRGDERWLLGDNQQLYRKAPGNAQPEAVQLPEGVENVVRIERVTTEAGVQLQIAAQKAGRLQQFVYLDGKWKTGVALDSAVLFVNPQGLSNSVIGSKGYVQTRDGERYAIHNGELHYQRAGDNRWHSTGVHNLSQLKLGGDGQLYALRGINELVTINPQTKSIQYGLPATKDWGNDRQQTQLTPDSLVMTNHIVSDFTVGQDGQIHFIDHQGQLYEYDKANQQAKLTASAPQLKSISSNKQGQLVGLTRTGEVLKQVDSNWRAVATATVDENIIGLNHTSTGELAVIIENNRSTDGQLAIRKTINNQGQLGDIPQEAIIDQLFQRLKQQDVDQMRLPGTGLTAKGSFAFAGVESGNPTSDGINTKDYLAAHLYHKKPNWFHWPRPLKAIGYHFQHRARGREGLQPLYNEIGNSFNQLLQHLSTKQSGQQPTSTLSSRIEQALDSGRITQEQKEQLLALKQQLEAETLSYLNRLGKKKGLLTESGEVNQQFTGNNKAKIGRFLNPRITSHDLTRELNQLWENYQGDESNSTLSKIKKQLKLMQDKGLYLRHPGQNNWFTRRDYDDSVGLLTARVVHNSNTLADLENLIKVINGAKTSDFDSQQVKQLITEIQGNYDNSTIKKYSDMGFSNLDRLESSYDAMRFFSKAFSKTHHPVYQNAANTFGSESSEQLKANLYDAITHLKKGETLTFDRNYSGGSSPFLIINKLQQLVNPVGVEFEPGVKAERHYGLSFEKTDKGIKVSFIRDMSVPVNVTVGGYVGTPGVASARVGGALNPTLKHDKNNQLAFEIDNNKVDQFLNELTRGQLKPAQLLEQGHDYAVKKGHKWGFDLDVQAVAEARLTGSGSTGGGDNAETDGVTDLNGWARAKGGVKFTLNILSANKDRSTTNKDNGEQTQSRSSNRPRFFTKAGLDIEATSHFKFGVAHDEFATNALSYSAGGKWSGSVESKTSKSYDVTTKLAEQVELTEWQSVVEKLQQQFKDDLTPQQRELLDRVANIKNSNDAGAAEAIKQLQSLDFSQTLLKLEAAGGNSKLARHTLEQLGSLKVQQQLAEQGKYTVSDVSFGKTVTNLSRLDERGLLGWAGAQLNPNHQQQSSSRTLSQWMDKHPELKTLVDSLKQSDATEAKITMELTEHAKLKVARLMASNDSAAPAQLVDLLNDRSQFRIKSIEVSASAKNNSAFGQSIGLANFKSAAATSIKKKLGKISFNYDTNDTTPKGYQLEGELLNKTPQQLQATLRNFEQTHQQRLLNVADSVNQHNMNALVADPIEAARAALLSQLSELGINQVTPAEIKGMAQRTQELYSRQLSSNQQTILNGLLNDPIDNRATALKQVTDILTQLKQQQPKLNVYQQSLYQRAHLASQRHADITRLLAQATNQVATTETQTPGTILQFVRGQLAYQNRLLTQTEAMQVVRHFGDQILQKMQSGYSGFAAFAGESPFNGEDLQRIVQRQENVNSIKPRIGQSPRLRTLKVGDLINLLVSGELTLKRLNPAQRLLINEYFPGGQASQQQQLQALADNPAKLAAIIHQANQYSPAELVASDRITGPTGQRGLEYLLSWDQFVLEGATKFKQQVASNAKVNFAPQSLYVQLSQSGQPKGRCTGLAMAYLQLLSQNNGVAKKNKLFETLVTHSAIYQQSIDEGVSGKEVKDANQFATLIDQLHETSQNRDSNNPLQAMGELSIRDIVGQLTASGDQYLVLNTGNHSLAVAKKGNQFFFYDPNFADVQVASASNLQQVLTKHFNLALTSQANQSLAELYQTKQSNNKPTLSVFRLDTTNVGLTSQTAKLNQFVNTEQLMTERDRLAQLGEAELEGQKINWTTLYDMGASLNGRRLTADDVQNLQQTGRFDQLQFDRALLGEFVTQRVQTLDSSLPSTAQWLKKVVNQREGSTSLLTNLTEGQNTAIADDFLASVKQHVNNQLNVDPEFWQSLASKVKSNSHLATANSVSNKVGKGLQGYGYYQNIMGIFNALRRSNQPGADQSEINKEIGLAAGGLAADLLEPLAEKGLQKAGLSLVNRFGQSASTAGKFAGKLGSGLMRAGGAVLGVLTSGFDIYSAVDSFKKLASETDPKKRQDLIVNGSLSVSGAVVGIATAVAIGIGGTAAAVAGPIGVAAAVVLAIGGQIYNAVRQIDEIDDYISLTTGERLRNGWYAFWGKELDEDVVRRYGKAKAEVEGRKLFDKGLREGSTGQLDSMLNTVDTVVYSKGDVEVKETKYYEKVRRESSGGYAGIGRVWYEDVARYKHEPKLEESNDNVDLTNGVAGHAQIRYYKNQTDEKGNTTKKEVEPTTESYRVKVGSRPVGKLGMAPVYETRTREITPDHDLKVKSFASAGSNTAAVQTTQQDDNKAAFINLGEGNDTAKGFTNKRNIFVVGEGEKSFTGGNKDDAFILAGGAAPTNASQLSAGKGNDTIIAQGDLTGRAEDTGYRIDLNQGDVRYRGSNKKVATINGFENAIGQAKTADELIGNDQTNTLNGNGGGDTLKAGGGNDILFLHGGDHAEGGQGIDTYYVTRSKGEITIKEEADLTEVNALYLDYDINEMGAARLEGNDILMDLTGDNNEKLTLRLKDVYKTRPDGTKQLQNQFSMVTRDGFLVVPEWAETISSQRPFNSTMAASFVAAKQNPDNIQQIKQDLSGNETTVQITDKDGATQTLTTPEFIRLIPAGWEGSDVMVGGNQDDVFMLDQGQDEATGNQGQDTYIIGRSGDTTTNPAEKVINNFANPAQGTGANHQTSYEQDYLVMAGVRRDNIQLSREGDDLLVNGLKDNDQKETVRLQQFFKGEAYQHISIVDEKGGQSAIEVDEQGNAVLSNSAVISGTESADDLYTTEREQGSYTLLGEAGDDRLQAKHTVVTQADSYTLTDGDILIGGEGNDTLRDSLADDVLIGGKDNDIIVSSWGDDQIDTGTGYDQVRLASNAQGVKVINANNSEQTILWVPFALKDASYHYDQGSFIIEGKAPRSEAGKSLTIVLPDYLKNKPNIVLKSYDGSQVDGEMPNHYSAMAHGAVALNQGGNDQYFTIENSPLAGLDEFTVQMSFRSDRQQLSGNDYVPLISYAGSHTANEFLLGVHPGGLNVWIKGKQYTTSVKANELLDGQYHDVTTSWNNNTGKLDIYVDGQLRDSVTTEQHGKLDTAGRFIIGQEQDQFNGGFDNTQFFRGSLADLKIFKRQVTPLEAEQISSSNEMEHWRFTNYSSDYFNEDTLQLKRIDGFTEAAAPYSTWASLEAVEVYEGDQLLQLAELYQQLDRSF